MNIGLLALEKIIFKLVKGMELNEWQEKRVDGIIKQRDNEEYMEKISKE